MIELDLEIHLEALERIEARPLVAVADLHGLLHADEALGRGLLLDARGLQQKYERAGAAVHDRHFAGGSSTRALSMPRPAKADSRCSTVEMRAAALYQRGTERGLTDVLGARGNIHRLRQIDAAKADALIGGSGLERHHDFLAGMQSHAGGPDRIAQRSLADHSFDPTGITLRTRGSAASKDQRYRITAAALTPCRQALHCRRFSLPDAAETPEYPAVPRCPLLRVGRRLPRADARWSACRAPSSRWRSSARALWPCAASTARSAN